MFEHSIKVPRHYKIAANIFKKVSTEGGSIKTLLYDSKNRHFRKNVLYALISEAIKHASLIDNIFENTDILKNEPRLDPWLARVLTSELLFGKKCLPGKSKPEQTVLSYKDRFEKYTSEHQDDLKTQVPGVGRPRYVRVNTNLLTTSDAIREFQNEGYTFVRCTSGSYDDYLKQIQNLQEYDFTQDYHVKTVFVFPSFTKFHDHPLYLENKLILQNKATTMAVHLLAPPTGSVVLDMCAAPGMKTTQLAAYMRNNGTIYAIERNEDRYKTLCDFVEKTGSTCVKTINKDSLEIKKGDYDDVEYILLDPSCSGSGMDLQVHSYIEEARLAKLTSLQEKFLKHAMNAFPNAKRIVYSTCSLRPEENERVITNVVKTSRTKWRVQDVKELLKGQWNNVGSGMYGSMGVRCMYCLPESDLTIGFFLAVLDRDRKEDVHDIHDLSCTNNGEIEEQGIKKRQKSKSVLEEPQEGSDQQNELVIDENEDKKERKSKKKKKSEPLTNERTGEDLLSPEYSNESKSEEKSLDVERDDQNEVVKHKKRKKRNNDENEQLNYENETRIEVIQELDDTQPVKKKKKKSKTKENKEVDLEEISVDVTSKKNKKKNREIVQLNDENKTQIEVIQELDNTVPVKKKNKNSTTKESKEVGLEENNVEVKCKKNKKKNKDIET